MKPIHLLLSLIVSIIIIGGAIVIIWGRGLHPEPDCLVCGSKLIRNLAILEVALGISALVTAAKMQEEVV